VKSIRLKFLIFFFTVCDINIYSQESKSDSTEFFKENLKKLIAINSATPNLINLSGKEAIILSTGATANQIIEITAPYITSTVTNAKTVCFDLLSEALFKKTKGQIQRQQITEILCKNFLNIDSEIQIVDNVLLQLSEKDFTPNAKNYISALIIPNPKTSYSICAKLLAVAQVREAIPILWKSVDTNLQRMTPTDVDILSALARLNETRASFTLCNYYNKQKNRTDYRYIFLSNKLAFSLDSLVLACLICDFKTLDVEKAFRDSDAFFYPSGYLATNIVAMLGNYPYSQERFDVDAKHLLKWLTDSERLQLRDK